jgi:hypothetical protein
MSSTPRREPGPPGTADGRYRPVGAVVHLLATVVEEGRDLSWMSGVLAESSYRLLPA